MKCFCELHHQPWFKCGVCADERAQAEQERVLRLAESKSFMARMLAGYSLLPWLGCRVNA